MNIVYLLSNIDKVTYPNKYIGSKQDCKVVSVDGLPTIISVKTGKPYVGSSSNTEMRRDIARGDRFKAEILEVVKVKKHIRDREDAFLKEHSVATSKEYYNLSDCAFPSRGGTNQEAVNNLFGETTKKIASERSSMAKRDNRARKCGFDNYGRLYLYIHEQSKAGISYKDISESLGQERHFASRYMKDFNMDAALKEAASNTHLAPSVRELWWKGATLGKIAELLKIDKVTARYFLGGYSDDRAFGVSRNLGKTKDELEIEITKMILDGSGFNEVAQKTGIVVDSVKRYFFRCIRSRLKSSDL